MVRTVDRSGLAGLNCGLTFVIQTDGTEPRAQACSRDNERERGGGTGWEGGGCEEDNNYIYMQATEKSGEGRKSVFTCVKIPYFHPNVDEAHQETCFLFYHIFRVRLFNIRFLLLQL